MGKISQKIIIHVLLGLCLPNLTLGQSCENNVAPRFVDLSIISFPEDKKIGDVVHTVSATDEDDDTLSFSITSDILRIVKIAPKAADLVLKAEVDYEQIKEYVATLRVVDKCFDYSQKIVNIYIQDVNDNAPTFINLPYRTSMPEDSPIGTPVLKVSATDPDSGAWGQVMYNITLDQETRQGLFSINIGSGHITLSDHLDYETERSHQLEVMAVDGGGLNTTTVVNVNVLDVQDTPPFFLNLPARVSIYENVTVGHPMLKVSAMDGDRGIPNEVNYTFSGGDFQYFDIQPDSGQVTVNQRIDRESPDILELAGVLSTEVLTREVTDTPQGPTTAISFITIIILDINDNVPTFNYPEYHASVLENTQAGIPVSLPQGIQIVVSDWDEKDNGRFELVLEKDGAEFDVFEVYPDRVLNEGNVILKVKNGEELDYEEVKEFTFEMIAREYLTPERFESRVPVNVSLIDVNDNWPEFAEKDYAAEILENSPRGTPVITITATDRDSGEFGKLTYFLRGGSENLFAVDENTGAVTIAVDADQDLTLLDRETMDTHVLTFLAIDGGGLQTTVQLEITLLDVNDNPPFIMRGQYDGFIRENQPQFERPVIVEAVDFDLPPNNIIRFALTAGDPLGNFTIGDVDGMVQVKAPLDYEAMDPTVNGVFSLTVTARDLGIPSLSSTASVIINVQDENDKTPYFEKALYTAIIPENAPGLTEVVQITAQDDDGTPPNNEIFYRIESGAQDKFRVDSNTGVISVVAGANLDRDIYEKEYQISALAIDRGTPSLTGSTDVVITITDINNKFPVFSPDIRSLNILEDTKVGTDIITYSATDLDENAFLSYSLLEDRVVGRDENGINFPDKDYLKSRFEINPETGTISVKNELDRETVEHITIFIFVMDLNAEEPPLQNATAELRITLDDVNDNPPVFDPSSVYYARVSEASKPGVEVTRVVAIDKDKNPGPIQYYVSYDTDESYSFAITEENRLTGIITLASEVDYEEYQWINITVEAVDAGLPSLSNFAIVHIEIEDVNDNSPEWQIFETPVYVLENATAGTAMTTVYATDKDSGEFGRVMYFLENPAQPFSVENETGLVTTKGGLNREERPAYFITIEARDNNFAPPTQQRMVQRTMEVILIDVNDNAPVFDSSLYEAEILENAAPGASIVTVRATDADEGINAEIVYSVDVPLGNATDLFDVNPDTGIVIAKRSLKGNIGVFYITVRATDKGDPPLSDTTIVMILVTDINDHAPVIIYPQPNATIYIMENVPIGYWVTEVLAEDEDVGINGEVRFELTQTPGNNDWRKFHITNKDGNLTTNSYIDREEKETYLIEIRAYDLGTRPTSYDDRRLLTIVALDEDDNPPSFDREKYPPPFVVEVEEEQSNIFVANLDLAEDPDIGNNSIICYYLVGGNSKWKDHFRVVKTTGDLWLDTSIDREVVAKVPLVIKASEDCWTGFWERPENRNVPWNVTDTSLLLVDVNILDINDNPPRFSRPWFTAGVTKDTQFGEDVLDLSEYAHDPDEGENAVMYFSLLSPFRISEPLGSILRERGDDVPFALGRMDGIIRTNIYFQSDMQGYIEFEVKVEDINPDHFHKSNVSIYLINEEQRVKVIIRDYTSVVGTFKDYFAEVLSNVTGVIINVDKILTHQGSDGKADNRSTDMFIHGINPETGQVLSAYELIYLIDINYSRLINLFDRYNVIEVQPAVMPAPATESALQTALIVVAVILFVLILTIVAAFVYWRKKYKLKLKAANAAAFGSKEKDLNKLEMPGTNLHTLEGSNPIWMEKYENTHWSRDVESESSCKNSIDENILDASAPPKDAVDYQQLTLDMMNDEYDHPALLQNSRRHNTDAYLKAALQEHEKRESGLQNGGFKTTEPANDPNIGGGEYDVPSNETAEKIGDSWKNKTTESNLQKQPKGKLVGTEI